MRRELIAVSAILVAACGSSTGEGDVAGPGGGGGSGGGGAGGNVGQPAPGELYGPGIEAIAFEIDYASGAEPYTGSVVGFGEIWNVSENNINRLFEGTGHMVILPRELGAMEELTDVVGTDFDGAEIHAIAAAHRDLPPLQDGTASIYVVWLDGHYRDSDGVNMSVLGVTWVSTGIIAMFKPAIAASGVLDTRKYVEQVTLVHEAGHAFGLVNNGIEMAAAHQDTAHGAHCDNHDCVMYWAVEGTSGALDFITQSLTSPEVIVWDDACLADAAAAIH